MSEVRNDSLTLHLMEIQITVNCLHAILYQIEKVDKNYTYIYIFLYTASVPLTRGSQEKADSWAELLFSTKSILYGRKRNFAAGDLYFT